MSDSNLATLIQASAHHLPMIDDKSVQCVVTSPPYFGLRKYDGAQDVEWGEVSYSPVAGLPPLTVPAMTCPLGNEPTIEAFIGHLILCAREWRRVLADDGVMFVNLGDSYANDDKWGGSTGGKHVKALHGNTGIAKAKRKTGIPPKSLMMIPARFALAMQADGWILRSDVIWAKGISFCESYSGSVMPESVKDRPTRAHEHIFMFAKQERYYYDLDAVREPLAESTIGRYSRGWNGTGERGYVNGVQNHMKKFMENEEAKEASIAKGRNIRDVFAISPKGYAGAHFAAFPEQLIEPLIKAGTRVHDTVLDPFNGSGTTGRVAIKLGRRYIGVDLSERYLDELAPERLTVQMEMVS